MVWIELVTFESGLYMITLSFILEGKQSEFASLFGESLSRLSNAEFLLHQWDFLYSSAK